MEQVIRNTIRLLVRSCLHSPQYPLLFSVMLATMLLLPGKVLAESIHATSNTIVWQRASFPPVTIPEGLHANEGFFDKVMLILIYEIPGYEHIFQTGNFKRIMQDIERGENVCCPSLYKTPDRERFVAFSAPAMVVLPNGIITTQKNSKKLQPHMDENGTVSLSSLLEDGEITLGVSSGRKYAGGLDELLKRYSGKDNLVVRSGEDVFKGLMLMMEFGRIDCVMGYPIEASYLQREGTVEDDFVYYPVKESTVSFTVGHIGCPNTPWGKRVIEEVDNVVMARRTTDFIDFYGEWLDEKARATHREIATSYFESLGK